MVLFTYLHEVMQAKLLWWFFYQQDFLSFPDLEKVCESSLTNKPRPALIKNQPTNNVHHNNNERPL